VDHFLGIYCLKNGRSRLMVHRDAMAKLLDYGWPGNVRELENVVERAAVLCRSDAIHVDDLPEGIALASAPPPSALTFPMGTTLDEMESRMIRETLKHTEGDKSLAAQLLGISTRTIYRKLGESAG
jgi:two-component system response regulator HydG